MAETMIRRLTARDARLNSFRFYDLFVHLFMVVRSWVRIWSVLPRERK